MAAGDDSPEARKRPSTVAVESPITLGQFVKLAGMADTGGDAKRLVVAGLVRVNGAVEQRRGRKLVPGDVVEVQGKTAVVAARRPPSSQG
jgi:ribosome-associated protein